MGGFLGAVRHMDDGGPVPLQVVEHAHHVGACHLVQHRGRLVENQQSGLHRQHAGDGGALLLPAAHTGRIGLT